MPGPGSGKRAAALVTRMLQGMNFIETITGLMDAILKGFAVAEVMWEIVDGEVVPKRAIMRDQRRFLMGQPYVTIWGVFGLVAAVSSLAQWALSGLSVIGWSDIRPVLASTLVTTFLFPLVTMLLITIHRILPVTSRTYP